MGVFAAKRADCESNLRSAWPDEGGSTPEPEAAGDWFISIQPGATQLTLTSGAKALAMAWLSM